MIWKQNEWYLKAEEFISSAFWHFMVEYRIRIIHSIHFGFGEKKMELCQKLSSEHFLSEREFVALWEMRKEEEVKTFLQKEALRLRHEHFGNKIYIRGLIEFTNYCKNDCFYCGIRCTNQNVSRYRLTKDEILTCAREGYEMGFRTFVLQGGEDMWYTTERMEDLIHSLKSAYPDCALTLSVGEKSRETYERYKLAGADRYLLRHETADEVHYGKLHPSSLKLSNRMECLRNLKELGFQVGAGFMVGSPYQSAESIAKDLYFLETFQPHMVGIGPFIPHHDTCFAHEKPGSVEDTLFLLSVVRILLPKVLLPATTALGTLQPDGRELGILHGANVVMPNLSPTSIRKKYELYDNKISTGAESAQNLEELTKLFEAIGYRLSFQRGDAPGFSEENNDSKTALK